MTRKLNVGVLMDPIESIKIAKDSTFAMLLEAQRRGHDVFYVRREDLRLEHGRVSARMSELKVWDDPARWFELGARSDELLADKLDVLLMRKDPPFNMQYIYDTYLLELAEQQGLMVVNRPQALRDANEKLFTAWFPDCTPPSLVTRNKEAIRAFVADQQQAILKPLDGMGGASIFRTAAGDPNLNVIIETLTEEGQQPIMAQRFLPEITEGDKRILLVDGEPVPYALARIPVGDEFRGNLARGGRGEGVPLSDRD